MCYTSFQLWRKYVNREPRLGAAIVLLLIGAIMSPGVFLLVPRLMFVLDGETVQAKVVAKQIAVRPVAGPPVAMAFPLAHGGGRRGPRHLLRYEFVDAAGVRRTGEGAVSTDSWNNARPGDALTVRYLRSDPAKNIFESEVWNFKGLIPFTLISLAAIVAALWQGAKGLRVVARQVRLVRDGEAVAGTITKAELERSGKRGRNIVSVFDYEYELAERFTGQIRMRGQVRPDWQPGTAIVILIDPYEPAIHAPDIFDARIGDSSRAE